jgi:hypothetical protein
MRSFRGPCVAGAWDNFAPIAPPHPGGLGYRFLFIRASSEIQIPGGHRVPATKTPSENTTAEIFWYYLNLSDGPQNIQGKIIKGIEPEFLTNKNL